MNTTPHSLSPVLEVFYLEYEPQVTRLRATILNLFSNPEGQSKLLSELRPTIESCYFLGIRTIDYFAFEYSLGHLTKAVMQAFINHETALQGNCALDDSILAVAFCLTVLLMQQTMTPLFLHSHLVWKDEEFGLCVFTLVTAATAK